MLRRLFGRRSVREAEGALVVEGAKVLGEAISAGASVRAVYLDPAAGGAELDLASACAALGARVFELDAGVLARVTDVVTPQPVVAVIGAPVSSLEALGAPGPDFVVVCTDVRDPGNAGTVLRSAEAAGAGGVVFCDGCVDVFNPKAVRASAGAVFHVPVVNGHCSPADALAATASWGLARMGTVAEGGVDYLDADLGGPVAIVLGNEAHGLAPEVVASLDGCITIPMVGRAESLNVGMAAAILTFEVARRRRRPAVVAMVDR